MKQLAIILTLVILSSCKKEEFDIHNLNGDRVMAIGHGGMGISYAYPMNSYEGIRYALALGADGVEIDVDMTSDGVLVAFHDEDLSEATNGAGKVCEHTWEEIKNIRFRSVPYSSYKLRSVEEILAGLPNRKAYKYFFDCKLYKTEQSEQYLHEFNYALIKLIDKYEIVEQSYVELKQRESIEDLMRQRSDIKTIVYADFDKAMIVAEEFNMHGIIQSMEDITEDQVKLAHSKGFRVGVFNIKTSKDNERAIRLNVEYAQSDKLKDLLDKLR